MSNIICPLRDPLSKVIKKTKLCADMKCSDNCLENDPVLKYRYEPFGVEFEVCKRQKSPLLQINSEKDFSNFSNQFEIINTLSADQRKAVNGGSTISTARHKKTRSDVFIKSFAVFRGYEPAVENLLYEIKVYEAIKELSKAVPHFVNLLYVSDFSEDALRSLSLTENENNLLLRNVEEFKRNVDPDNNYGKFYDAQVYTHYVMVTTKAPGLKMRDYFLKSYSENIVPLESTIWSIIFQILFCLHCMSMMGFQHNDLHLQNIFIDPNPECKQGLYIIAGRQFLVPLPAKIYIYDFDLSSCAQCGENKYLSSGDLCSKFGICNQRNHKFDMYTVFKHLKQILTVKQQDGTNRFLSTRKIFNFLNSALGSDSSITPKANPYGFCNIIEKLDEEQTEYCRPFIFPEPLSVQLPVDLLLEYFTNERIVGFTKIRLVK